MLELNDFELFGQWVASARKQRREKVFRLYYNLACCSAWESLAVLEQRVGFMDKWNLLSTKFRDVLSGYPLIEANREGSLKFFPDQTWPEGFLEYCDQQHQRPTNAFLNANPSIRNSGMAEQTVWFTGYRVEEKAKECGDVVNNKLNAAWADSLFSGCSYPVFMIALRKTLWHDFCLDAAKQSVRSRSAVKLKGGEPSLKFSARMMQWRTHTL